ncbi:MAG: bifunctional diguanylate cyclase/phosphodiesterase [Hyphomicrobiaceae bacterium]
MTDKAVAAPDGGGITSATGGSARTPRAGSSTARLAPLQRRGGPNVELILASVNATTYQWDLRSDQMIWQGNAVDLLMVPGAAFVSTGASYHLRIASEHAGARVEAIRSAGVQDKGEGVPFRLRYRFMPDGRRGRRSIWLEDEGRWHAGPDGQPATARGVVRIVDDRIRDEERLRYLSEHDATTGLLNTDRLTAAVQGALAGAAATGRPFAFLLVAVSNLGIVNETFGFEVGNEVLKSVAQRLESEIRAGDRIGRFSANKFGIVVHDCEAEGVQAVGRRLLECVRGRVIETSACRLTATVSIGAVQAPRHAGTVDDVVAAALEALDEAKTGRQDRLVVYQARSRRMSRRKRNVELTESVISAVEEGRMLVALQPIVAAASGEVVYHECLLRMRAPDGSIVSAGEFIPVAEQIGLSRLIDHHILDLAVGLLRRDPALRLSFNVSGNTPSDHEWLIAVDRLTAGDRSLTSRMMVEITETIAIGDMEECVAFVDALKELGLKVALDDFGAGYTSFRYLKHLGADVVKIDGAFIRNLGRDSSDYVFVETLVHLASSFGMETVAEWVGDAETAAILKRAGIGYMQGELFGMPVLADETPASGTTPADGDPLSRSA